MNITTRTQDFEMSSAIDQFARNHVHNALRHFSDDILSVDVFMKDTNGPKGGVDKLALLRVQLRNRQAVALESTHESLYGAIKRGSKRIKRAVRRQLRKSRRIDKRRMRDHLEDAVIPGAL